MKNISVKSLFTKEQAQRIVADVKSGKMPISKAMEIVNIFKTTSRQLADKNCGITF